MKKKILVLVLLSTMIFTGCGGNIFGNLRAKALSIEAKINQGTTEEIMEAVDNKDPQALYDMFAPCVQDENENLMTEVEEFIDSFEGEFVSCDSKGGSESEGKHHQASAYTYKVTTTEKEYYIHWKTRSKYEDESLNGLISVGVQGAEDYDTNGDFFYDKIESAYVVTEDNHEEIEARFGHIVGRDVILCEINEESFPDPILRKYVLEEFDDDIIDGQLSKYEASYHDTLKIEGTADEPIELKDLTGVEYLEGLIWLRVDYTEVSEIDVSYNTKLEVLACEHTNVKTLDFSNNPEMRIVECDPSVKVTGYDGSISQLYD